MKEMFIFLTKLVVKNKSPVEATLMKSKGNLRGKIQSAEGSIF